MDGDCLNVREGPAAGRQIALGAELWIGREAEAGGDLGGDGYLSRHHARISRGLSDEVVIEDLGSTNGTFVNGERLRGSRALRDGDNVKVGHTVLEVVLPSRRAGPEDTEIHPAPAPVPLLGSADATRDLNEEAASTAGSEASQPAATPGATGQPNAEPLRHARLPPPVVGSPSVIRAGLPSSMKGLIFPSVGLLIVQIIVGYEWLLSGLTKIFRGGFPSGLGADLRDMSKDAAGWYRDILHSIIIPIARPFGYVIEVTELVVGVVLIWAALQWLFRWQSMHRQARTRMLLGTVAACGAAIVMNVNFYLASGDPPPFFLAKDAFDEGVGLDVVLPALELVIGGVALWTFLSIRRARNAPTPRTGSTAHVVVAGGGFAGLSAARALRRYAPAGVRVTVISDTNFLLYTPLLPGVAASALEATSVVVPLREQLLHADLRVGRIVGGDPGTRELVFEPLQIADRPGERTAASGPREAIGYDELILAVGSVARTREIPGLTRHAIGLKTLSEAVALRNWLIRTLEVAEGLDDSEQRQPFLTYVFAGAGYAGVEGIAELHDFAAKAINLYPRCREQGTRWILVQGGGRIMPEIDSSLSAFAARKLTARGIEILTGTRLVELDESSVRLSTGESVSTRTVVWTAGVRAHPVVEELALPLDERGRIAVSAYMQVAGQQHIWAVGDAAAVPNASTDGTVCPPTAQHAIQQGRAVAANVAAVLGSGQPRPFAYRSRGVFVELGRRRAVADILGVRVRGCLAWLLARAYHASRMPGVRRKFRLLGDWGMDLVQGRDTAELGALGHPRALMGELEEKSSGGSVIARRGAAARG